MRLRQSPQLLWTCLLASILLGPASDLYSQQKPKVLIPPGTKVTKDIVYAQHDGVDLLLDLYLPKSNPEEKLPTILWVHGEHLARVFLETRNRPPHVVRDEIIPSPIAVREPKGT